MAVAFMQHFQDFSGVFRIIGHKFGLLSGSSLAEYSDWEINQNKCSTAWEKTLPDEGKAHNRAIIPHRATGRKRLKSAEIR
jgi:hypothetical protein